MQAKTLEVAIGSAYSYECSCGAEIRASGPIHMQPTAVRCGGCGAVYEFRDGGYVSLAEAAPEPQIVQEAPAVIETPAPSVPKKAKGAKKRQGGR